MNPRTSSDFERIAGAARPSSGPARWPTWTWRPKRAAAPIAATAGSPHRLSIDHVDLAAGGLADALGQVALGVELDDRVGAEVVQPLEAARPRARRRRRGPRRGASRPAPRRCRPGRWRRARARSPPAQVCAPFERQPAGEAGAAERRGACVVERVGDVEQRVGRGDAALGHRAVGRDGVEEDAAPVADADAVAADHRRERLVEVEVPARLEQVEVVDRGAADLDEHLAGLRLRLGEVLVPRRRAVLVKDRRVHRGQIYPFSASS